MALLKELQELDRNASLEHLQDALADLGPLKVNQVMKNLKLNPRGRRSQDVFEVTQSINKGKVTINEAIEAFNSVVGSVNSRRNNIKDFFTKENIEDLFEDISEWILFALSLWNSRK